MIAGPAGIGKSLLLEVLAQQFKGRWDAARLTGGHLTTRRALLQVILFELGLSYRGKEDAELRLSLIEHLTRSDRSSSGLLLLVDEAHNLPLRLLEEIRMVTNIIRDGEPRVHLVLAGGPALEEKLAHPKLDSLSQRLAARCYLEPLTRAETYSYVAHQICQAGGDWENVFSRPSCEAVYRATAGIPRLINQVADHALMLAYADGMPQVDPALVERAWSELQQLPAPWVGADLQQHPPAQPTSVVEFGQLSDELLPVPDSVHSSEVASDWLLDSTSSEASLFETTSDRAEESLQHVEQHLADLSEMSRAGAEMEAFEDEELLVDRYHAAIAAPSPLASMPTSPAENCETPLLSGPMVQDRDSFVQEVISSASYTATESPPVESAAAQEAEICLPEASSSFQEVVAEEEIIFDRYAKIDAHRTHLVDAATNRGLMAATARMFAAESLAKSEEKDGTVSHSSEESSQPLESKPSEHTASYLPEVTAVADELNNGCFDVDDLSTMTDVEPLELCESFPGTEAEYPLDTTMEQGAPTVWIDEHEGQEARSDDHATAWQFSLTTVHAEMSLAEPSAMTSSRTEEDPKSDVAVCTADLPELVILEDPPMPAPASEKPAAEVRRQEYRQLFARLRRGP